MLQSTLLLCLAGFNRNTEAKLDNITLNGVQVGRVRINENRELSRFTDLNDVSTSYDYALSTGLLQHKKNSRGQCQQVVLLFTTLCQCTIFFNVPRLFSHFVSGFQWFSSEIIWQWQIYLYMQSIYLV